MRLLAALIIAAAAYCAAFVLQRVAGDPPPAPWHTSRLQR
ncbi:hypothetical protein ABIF63_004818 [Bradyrhizobium japonicum]|uniref:Uncharacterized protein n=1 Tax=Bradyrhizobium japonicum TaxID=375 RepID=A0ABV2RUZ4_BRAJP